MKRFKLSRALTFVMALAFAAGILGVSGTALATVDSVGISPSIAPVTVGSDTYIPLRVGESVTLVGSAATTGSTVDPATGYAWALSGGTNVSLSASTGGTITVTGLSAADPLATITLTATDSDTATGTAAVNIKVLAMSTSDTGATLIPGATKQLNVGNALAVAWTSSNTSAATVSSAGLVTAVAGGTATITATSNPGGAGVATQTKTFDFTVPTITLTPAEQTITSASTSTALTLKVENAGDWVASPPTITWSSSNSTAGSLTVAPANFTVSGTTLTANATFVSNAAGTSASSTIKAVINGKNVEKSALVKVQTQRYLTIEGPIALDKTTKTGTYTVTRHEANGTVVDDDTSTVHWSWSSSYLSITSDTLNKSRAKMTDGKAQIQLQARYNTPTDGTKLYTWINSDTAGKVNLAIKITGLEALPQTGQDFTLAYVFGALSMVLIAAAGVLYGVRKKRTQA